MREGCSGVGWGSVGDLGAGLRVRGAGFRPEYGSGFGAVLSSF